MIRSKRHFRTTVNRPKPGDVVRGLLTVLTILFLSLQTPQAMALSGGSGQTILAEICNEDQTYLVEIEIGQTGSSSEECAHCSECTLVNATSVGLTVRSFGVPERFEFTATSFPVFSDPAKSTPEQYWSACRGPQSSAKRKIWHWPILMRQ